MPASTPSKKPEKKPPHRLAPPVPRTADGKFVKGFSGHPSGVRAIPPEIRELARAHGPQAIARLVVLMHSDDEAICIAAIRELLNRGYGRPESTLNLPNGGALVNVTMLAGSGPIRVETVEQADAVYREIMGNSQFDFSRIEWAPEQLPAAVVRPETQPKPATEPTEPIEAPPAAESLTDGPDLTPTTPAPSSMAGQPPTPAEALAAQDAILRTQRAPYITT
jgi:hypothetical protein